MKNTSSKYKELVQQSGRTFRAHVICTLADGTQRDFYDGDIMQNGLKIKDAVSNDGSFDVGCAIINELTLELDNSNKQLSNINFDAASFDVRIGLVVEQKYDGTIKTEWIKKGIYYTEEVVENDKYISITAYDAMAKFDKPYNSNLKFPQMLLAIFDDACNACGVPYASLNFPNNNFYVQSKEFIDESATYRDIISYIAQLACCFVRVNVDGMIEMRWYEENNREIAERQKISDSVEVTCALITAADSERQYIIGRSGYAVNIEDNPLAQGAVNSLARAFTDNILERTLTPFEGEILSDPSIEAGDIVTIYDYSGNAYKTPITSVTYSIDSKMMIACDAETANENNRSGGSQAAKVIAMAKKQTEQQISDYAVRAQQFNALTANSMGFYQTIEDQDDDSQIIYQHDKPILSESTTIWKKSGDTAAVSTDGGKTWKGIDKNGNAVFAILAAEGINADWINTGELNGNLIKGESITGDKIAAATITGDEIHGGSIKAKHIAAGAITATEIKAGAITADKIAAGAITADAIKTGTLSSKGDNPTKLNLSTGEFVSSNADGDYKIRIKDGKIYVRAGTGSELQLITSNSGNVNLVIDSITLKGSIDASGTDTSIGAKTVFTNILRPAGLGELDIQDAKIDGHEISFTERTLSDGTKLKYISWK